MFENEADYLRWKNALPEAERAAVERASLYFARVQMLTAVACLDGTHEEQVETLKDIVRTQQALLEETVADAREVGS